jgi:parkin
LFICCFTISALFRTMSLSKLSNWLFSNQSSDSNSETVALESASDSSTYAINVRYSYGSHNGHVLIALNPNWSIRAAKDVLWPLIQSRLLSMIDSDLQKEQVQQLSASHVTVIFAGQELSDDLLLQQSDLENHSWLNVICRPELRSCNEPNVIDRPLNECVTNLRTNQNNVHSEQVVLLQDEEALEHRSESGHASSRFFVYCDAPSCRCVRSGKLRVRCHDCKHDSLILCSHPNDWDDVLIAGRIAGLCQRDSCSGQSADFYFKCERSDATDHFIGSESINQSAAACSALPLPEFRHNTLHVLCLRCLETADHVFVFNCNHVLCVTCVIDFFRSQLDNRQFELDHESGYTVRCPIRCSNSLVRNTHVFHALEAPLYERYKRLATEAFVRINGGLYCPNCSEPALPAVGSCNRVVCPYCEHVFCRHCLGPAHITCPAASSNEAPIEPGSIDTFELLGRHQPDQSKWSDSKSMTVIRQITKACPACRMRVERNGGCAHMQCPAPDCAQEWCWICERPWTGQCQANHWFE